MKNQDIAQKSVNQDSDIKSGRLVTLQEQIYETWKHDSNLTCKPKLFTELVQASKYKKITSSVIILSNNKLKSR